MSKAQELMRRLFRLPQAGLILLIKAYRLLLSPSLGSACRFEPSCSAYGLEALERHGAVAGTGLGLKPVDQVDDVEEPGPCTAAHAAGRDGDAQVILYRLPSADFRSAGRSGWRAWTP